MNRKIDGMLLATFLTTIFYASTYPYIHKEVMQYASDSFIALNQIINCVSIVVFGSFWNKKGDKLFKFYPLFCVLECLLGIAISIYATVSKDILAYYILDTVVFALITRNIICGGIKLRALRYKTEESRVKFDNNDNSVCSIATIIGSVIAMILNLPFEAMLWLATLGNCIDNVFYICIYRSSTKK